jgi:large subunit ribosomal protein L18e
MRTGPTNPLVRALVQELRRESTVRKAPIWDAVADSLEKATRARREVNLSRLARNTKANEVVVVPGKVLGAGMLAHPVSVAAMAFSGAAREGILAAKGKCLTIQELMKQHPEGTGVRVFG